MKLSEELEKWAKFATMSDGGRKQHGEMAYKAAQLEATIDRLLKHRSERPSTKNRLLEIFKDPLREYNNLTAKQREVARLASQGLMNSEIANTLNITPTAVGSMLREVYWKTDMGKRDLVKNLIKQIEKMIR